jgi:hypothetical protein
LIVEFPDSSEHGTLETFAYFQPASACSDLERAVAAASDSDGVVLAVGLNVAEKLVEFAPLR